MDLRKIKEVVFKGFLANEEAVALYETAKIASLLGPCLEIGSYCGLSSVCLGLGCREVGGLLFSIDHHRGSEEQQAGQAYFDPELVDPRTGEIDTLPHFIRAIRAFSLEQTVIPIVASSVTVASVWKTPISLLFIDGGHSFKAVFGDYNSWLSHLMPGGYLLIHDIFSDASQGGQAPRCIYQLAIASGLFQEMGMVETMGILKRSPLESPNREAIRAWDLLR